MSDLFPTRRRSTPGRFPDVDTMVTRLKPSYPVYCLKPSRLADAARTFIEGFPGEVLYAVKCNPERAVISTLYEAGIAGFDVASLAEVALVADLFEEAELHFHHPIKSRAAIANAYRVYGVERFAVDHADELAKIHAETRGEPVVMMVRLTTDSSRSTYDLSAKFGASVPEAAAMMREAHRLGHQVGLYFHVGSQCPDPRAYDEAMAVVRAAMDHAPEVPVVALDVGGGFPGRYDMGVEMPPVGEYFAAVRRALDTIPPLPGRRILCEPGRALVADGLSLVVQVHLRKGDRLFINDGIYGSLSETVTGQLRFPARAIRPTGPLDAERQPFTIFGPTCDFDRCAAGAAAAAVGHSRGRLDRDRHDRRLFQRARHPVQRFSARSRGRNRRTRRKGGGFGVAAGRGGASGHLTDSCASSGPPGRPV